MIFRSRLFQKQFAIAAISILFCLFFGAWILSICMRYLVMNEIEKKQFPNFIVNYVIEESRGEFELGVKHFERLQGKEDKIKLALLNEKGEAIYPKDAFIPRFEKLPVNQNETISVGDALGPPRYLMTRLSHNPDRFLLVDMMPPFPGAAPGWIVLLPLVVLLLMVFLGIGVALMIIYRSLRSTVVQADEVISQLKNGNLKARFPIPRNDEIGKAMLRFNSMADEIEKLVDQLKVTEGSRNQLLQELTHDLRTPVASLQTILDGVFSSFELKGEVAELASLATKEVIYMGGLVEDLLLLAHINEPRYRIQNGKVDLLSLIEEESDSLSHRYNPNVTVEINSEGDELLIEGDQHLYRRLIRNTLDNAFAHASKKIQVGISAIENKKILMIVEDDGPGFPQSVLQGFGEKRGQRQFKKNLNGRISLGLGSVIMKSIVSIHRGTIKVENSKNGGAKIDILLPRFIV